MLASAKIISAVLFAVFTVIGIAVSNHTGSKMLWLVLWIIVILLNVAVFIITDYCKYLIKDRVIPYLEDDEQIEFKEYSIFLNDDDKPTEEEK